MRQCDEFAAAIPTTTTTTVRETNGGSTKWSIGGSSDDVEVEDYAVARPITWMYTSSIER